jgi:alpha-D-ribose 1-methylphosphonate 5-triphosphate synthase subunit PhnG
MVNKLSQAVQILARIFSRLDDIAMTETPEPWRARRPEWLRVLARADADELARHATPVLADHHFEWLRPPEQGLVMVRARIGNRGDRFNVGEATITRCAVRHQDAHGQTVAGVGHVLGLDAARAERVAKLDALLQHTRLHELLWQGVVAPLQAQRAQRDALAQQRTEATRVRFFTLQAEAA